MRVFIFTQNQLFILERKKYRIHTPLKIVRNEQQQQEDDAIEIKKTNDSIIQPCVYEHVRWLVRIFSVFVFVGASILVCLCARVSHLKLFDQKKQKKNRERGKKEHHRKRNCHEKRANFIQTLK